jgi:hypothetical protein
MKMKGARGIGGGGYGTNPDPAAAWKGMLSGYFNTAYNNHYHGSPRVGLPRMGFPPLFSQFAAAANPPPVYRAPPRRNAGMPGKNGRR